MIPQSLRRISVKLDRQILAVAVIACVLPAQVVHAMKSGAPSASEALRELAPGPMPTDRIVDNLLSDRPKIRRIRDLVDRGEPGLRALGRLIRESENNAVIYVATEALAEATHPSAGEVASRLYREGDPHQRADVAYLFAKHVGPAAASVLRRDLDASLGQLQVAASAALLGLTGDERYLDRLSQAAGNGGGWNLRNELSRLGELANPLIPKLERIHSAGDGERSDNARMSLIAINTSEAWRILETWFAKKITRGEKLDRCRALTKVGQAGPPAKSLTPVLQRVFEDRDEPIEVRAYARWAMVQINPPRRESRVFHVSKNHASASNNNPGTSDLPWATIQKAAETMVPGDRVIVHEGVYRERVRPFVGGTSQEPIIYEAAQGDSVVITGADPWQPDWRPMEELSNNAVAIFETDIERLPWDRPETWTRPVNNDVSARVEQIVLDGERLEKASTLAALQSEPFRVHYLSSEQDGERVVLSLPAGASPGDFDIERSVRPENFGPAVRGLGYVIVRGFEMVHAAPPYVSNRNVRQQVLLSAFNTHLGYRWTVEGNTIRSSSTVGLGIGQGYAYHHMDILPPRVRGGHESGGHLFLDNDCHDNGTAGIGTRGNGAIDLIVAHNRTNRNGWQGRLKDYESAGIKLMVTENTLLAHHEARDNAAAGIWFDWMNVRSRITRSLSVGNTVWGIFIEGGWGPVVIDHNVVLRTRGREDMKWAAGLYGHDASGITAFHNVTLGNEGFAINYRYHQGKVMKGRKSEASEITVVANVADNAGRGFAAVAPPADRARDNRFDGNLYVDRGGTGRFGVMVSGGAGRARTVMNKLGIEADADAVSFFDWRETLGHGDRSAVLPHTATELSIDDPSRLEQSALALRDRLLGSEDDHQKDIGFESLYEQPPIHNNPVHTSAANLDLPPDMIDVAWVAPGAGVSLWGDETSRGESQWMAWNLRELPWRPAIPEATGPLLQSGECVTAIADSGSLRPWPRLSDTPLPVRASESIEIPVQTDRAPILPAGFRVRPRGETLEMVPPADLEAKRFTVLIHGDTTEKRGWQRVELTNRPALQVGRVTPRFADGRRSIEVTARNISNRPLPVRMMVRTDAGRSGARRTIPPRTWNSLKARLAGGGDVVTADISLKPRTGPRVDMSRTMSFLVGGVTRREITIDGRVQDWQGITRHDIENFPNAVFPPAAAVAQMMSEGLGADFAVATRDDHMYVLVEVTDPKHMQQQEQPGKAWRQDSIQMIVAPVGERGRVSSEQLHEWLVNLKDGEVRTTPMTAPARSLSLSTAVRRESGRTIYEFSVPLQKLVPSRSLQIQRNDASPLTPVAFSLQVNNDNGSGLNGFRWFGGIGGETRHDPTALGRVWLENR